MARSNTWTNPDGLVIGYGTRDTHNAEDAVVHTLGRINQIEVHIDNSTISALAGGTAPSSKAVAIPAGSVITGGRLVIDEAFTDLTSIVIGTKGSDGVLEDADGLLTSTLLAALTVDTSIVLLGAQVQQEADSAIAVTDEDLYVSLDVTGTAPTAGSAVLMLEYQGPAPDRNAPAVITGAI